MPFQFPDPSVSTKATLPNGEQWEYINGAWRAVTVTDNDQAQIDDLKERVTVVETVNIEQDEEIEQNEELLEPVNSALVNLQSRLSAIEGSGCTVCCIRSGDSSSRYNRTKV